MKAAGDSVLLVSQEAPSVLLGAFFGEAVTTCQMLGPSSVVCDDGCQFPRSKATRYQGIECDEKDGSNGWDQRD